MTTSWETEKDDTVQTPPIPSIPSRLEFKVKAYLVLVDSDKQDWGIIEDTLNDLNWVPGKGEVVGSWSRPRYDNLIHISLATAIAALQDRSIQTFARYAEERRLGLTGVKKPTQKTKGAVEPTLELTTPRLSVEEELKFNSLRARLGRAK